MKKLFKRLNIANISFMMIAMLCPSKLWQDLYHAGCVEEDVEMTMKCH